MSLPHNIEAEQALLGALLFDNATIARIRPMSGADFYDPVHGRIFDEIVRRYRAGVVADGVTLLAWFGADSGVKEIGGAVYLQRLMDSAAPMTAQAQSYAKLIVDLKQRRDLIALAHETIDRAGRVHEAEAADTIAFDLEAAIQRLAIEDADKDAFVEKGAAAAQAVEQAELGEACGLSTGFRTIDEMIGGLRAKLYLLGAASSMGKTTLASAIGRNVAAQGRGVVEFMLEMDEVEDGLRTASALAFQNDHRVSNAHYLSAQRNTLKPDQWARMRRAANAAASLPIVTDYRQGRTIRQIEASARRALLTFRRKGIEPGLVIIDHEGLIANEPGARFSSQLEATNARAAALMALPQRLGVPVLCTGQLTKDGKRADGEERLPTTDDWKYGGALIEAAHAVMLLHRKAYYAERKPDHLRTEKDWDAIKSREATVIVDKARGGRRGKATLWMDTPSAAVWEQAA